MEFVTEEEIRGVVAAEFKRHRDAIGELLPAAEVEHIGATAVPGSLTKGDLDMLVRVPSEAFGDAAAALRSTYAIHQPENWTARFAGFKVEIESGVPAGIQLVVAGSDEDRLFTGWRDRLIADPELLERYNDLKRTYGNARPDDYRAAKDEFIAVELASL